MVFWCNSLTHYDNLTCASICSYNTVSDWLQKIFQPVSNYRPTVWRILSIIHSNINGPSENEGFLLKLLRNLKRCIYQHTNANTGCTAVFRFNPTSGAWESAVLRCWVCTISCSNLHSGPTRGTTGVPRTPVAPATINCCYFSKMCNSQKHLKPCLCSVLNFVFNRWQEIPSLKHGSGSS